MAPTPSPSRLDSGWLGRPEVQWLAYGLIVLGSTVTLVIGRAGTEPIDLIAADRAVTSLARHRVNPNTADWQDLAALPGLGSTLSKRIVAYREAKRDRLSDSKAVIFQSPSDLQAVKGIGPKRADALTSLLQFSD